MPKTKNKKEYILLDTNMYHGFFVDDDFEKTILPIFKKIHLAGYHFLIPQQIVDEINRNRYSSWAKYKNTNLIKTLEAIVLCIEKDEIKDLSNTSKLKKQINTKIDKLKKEDLKSYKTMTSPKAENVINSLLEISILIPDNIKIVEAVTLRKIKGNPPLDKNGGEDKSCDRYIWESVLNYFNESNIRRPKLFLFTKNNSDWCIKTNESKHILNPFLVNEFKLKFNGYLIWSNDLKDLPKISEKDKKSVEKIEIELKEKEILEKIQSIIAERLRISNSWGNTDKIIIKILPYIKDFNSNTISEILKASIENQDYSLGPYNQVIDASKAKLLFIALYNRSKEIDFSLSEWKSFYLSLDE
ncbi:DUF4935 domain-containing protein, partial [Patescibacteria group bacterium]|nr:DUF4935 domain-containing protein [Patescibacteria group bacterium]